MALLWDTLVVQNGTCLGPRYMWTKWFFWLSKFVFPDLLSLISVSYCGHQYLKHQKMGAQSDSTKRTPGCSIWSIEFHYKLIIFRWYCSIKFGSGLKWYSFVVFSKKSSFFYLILCLFTCPNYIKKRLTKNMVNGVEHFFTDKLISLKVSNLMVNVIKQGNFANGEKYMVEKLCMLTNREEFISKIDFRTLLTILKIRFEDTQFKFQMENMQK